MKPHDPSAPSPAAGNDDAWLESALRETARSHVTDDGFSAGVVAALPARRSPWTRWRRTIFLTAGALGGGVLAFALGGAKGFETAARALATAAEEVTPLLPSPDVLMLVVGAAVAATVIVVSNWRLWRSH